MAYEWRPNPGFNPPKSVSADEAAAEIERIRASAGGRVTPVDLVTASKPQSAVLHAAFEWDDRVAGHEHRLYQARHILKAVRVSREDAPSTPAYVHVRADSPKEPNYYQAADEAVQNPDEWERVVNALAASLGAAKRALDDAHRIAQSKGLGKEAALVVIAKAFATIDHALDGLRH